MKSLSDATFKTLAGDGAYQRGLKYYNDGRVGPLTISNNRITASVSGTEHYQVELYHTAKVFEGSCNCPASANFDFCKHCVAASLAYYYQTQVNQELVASKPENRLLDYLNTLTKPQLSEELFKLLQKDPATFDHWQLKATIASGGLSPADIRKRITRAIPYKSNGLWRYRDVAEYFDQSNDALSILADPLYSLEPNQAVKLVIYALQRLEKTLETIDDSGGYRFSVEEQLQKWCHDIFASEGWSTKDKSKVIVKLTLDPAHNYDFLKLPSDLTTGFDEAALKSLYQSIKKAWEALSPDFEPYSRDHFFYTRLENILIDRARSQNNIDREFEILGRGAVTVDRSLKLVHLAIQHGRIDEAKQWLKFAAQIKQPSLHELYDIESAQIDLWQAQDLPEKAMAAQWARFEEQESLEQLKEVVKIAHQLDKVSHWLDAGISHIKQQLESGDQSAKMRARAETLARIYLAYEKIEEAIKLSRQFALLPTTLIDIVNKTNQLDENSFSMIELACNRMLQHANNKVYKQVVNFLEQQASRIDQQQAQHLQQTVLNLYNKPENKRKVNFIKELKNAFPTYFNR